MMHKCMSWLRHRLGGRCCGHYVGRTSSLYCCICRELDTEPDAMPETVTAADLAAALQALLKVDPAADEQGYYCLWCPGQGRGLEPVITHTSDCDWTAAENLLARWQAQPKEQA